MGPPLLYWTLFICLYLFGKVALIIRVAADGLIKVHFEEVFLFETRREIVWLAADYSLLQVGRALLVGGQVLLILDSVYG